MWRTDPAGAARIHPGRKADAGPGRLPVLLYAPGLRDPHDDNAMTAADLASHGYVVVAMDDVDWHATGNGRVSNVPSDFDMSSPEAFRTMLRRLDAKVRRQAVRAGQVIDRLAGPASVMAAPWLVDLDLSHVGFFGWSFGGATAQEASIMDERIVAAVNMDGWLFGDAAAGRQNKPSMTILSDYAAPLFATLSSRDDATRFNAMMDVRDLREKIRLGFAPDGYFVRVPGAIHENFADKIFELAKWRTWARADPYATKRMVDDDLVAFFDRYLLHTPASSLADARPSSTDARFLETSKDWLSVRQIRALGVEWSRPK